MDMENVTMVRVEDILRNVIGSCDFGYIEDFAGETEDDMRTSFWRYVISHKAADSGFGHLVESIMERGWTSAIGWEEWGDGGYINEGHHRLVAAILLCEEMVPVTNYGTRDTILSISAHYNYDEHSIIVEF